MENVLCVFTNLILWFYSDDYRSDTKKRIDLRGDYSLPELHNMLATFYRLESITAQCAIHGNWYKVEYTSKVLTVRDIINECEVFRFDTEKHSKGKEGIDKTA